MSRTIDISTIGVAGRIRPVNEAYAQRIAASIEAVGLLERLRLRHTPNGKSVKWELVTGAHRLRALEITGLNAIAEGEHFEVATASADAARLMEAEENLARNDLTVLDRALTVRAWREVFERQNGKILRGGDQRANLALWSERVTGFSEMAAERMGMSHRALKRLNQIGTGLIPDLVALLQGDLELADNQALLLQLVSCNQRGIVVMATDGEVALREAIRVSLPGGTAPKVGEGEKAIRRIIGDFGRLSARDGLAALAQIDKTYPRLLDTYVAQRMSEDGA